MAPVSAATSTVRQRDQPAMGVDLVRHPVRLEDQPTPGEPLLRPAARVPDQSATVGRPVRPLVRVPDQLDRRAFEATTGVDDYERWAFQEGRRDNP